MMMHLQTTLLGDEDIVDPMKFKARKSVARFLGAAGLINMSKPGPKEKFLIAALVTPDNIQPRSQKDKERMLKFKSLLAKGNLWLEEMKKKIDAASKKDSKKEKSEKKACSDTATTHPDT